MLNINDFPDNLQVLHLSRNKIERVRFGLDGLTALRHLDLSYNNLRTLRGLEELESLMVLNIKGNNIMKIN